MINPIIISILLSISFIIILILNNNIKSKVINIFFYVLSLAFLILIILFDNSFIYSFLKTIITYLWYPNYLLFVITILVSIIVFILTLLRKKIDLVNKILNYILFIIMFSCYNIYNSFGIDASLYEELYQLRSVIILRIVNITFFIWLIIKVILKVRGKNEK